MPRSSRPRVREQREGDLRRLSPARASGQDVVIFNQFDELGNYLWHYSVTGPAMVEAAAALAPGAAVAGVVLATGSAGTIASGDFVKEAHPEARIAAVEALQCPTMLRNGYGSHRIEGSATSTSRGSTTSATPTR